MDHPRGDHGARLHVFGLVLTPQAVQLGQREPRCFHVAELLPHVGHHRDVLRRLVAQLGVGVGRKLAHCLLVGPDREMDTVGADEAPGRLVAPSVASRPCVRFPGTGASRRADARVPLCGRAPTSVCRWCRLRSVRGQCGPRGVRSRGHPTGERVPHQAACPCERGRGRADRSGGAAARLRRETHQAALG